MKVFLLLCLTTMAHAGLDSLKIKNADGHYVMPYGTGEAEKIQVQMSKSDDGRTPFTISKNDDSIVFATDFIDLTWKRADRFALSVKNLDFTGVNVQLASGVNYFTAANLSFVSGREDGFSFKDMSVLCDGTEVIRDPFLRFLYNCENKAEIKVKRLELPLNVLNRLQLPPMPEDPESADIPANDLEATIKNGKLYGQMRLKILVTATMKVWGHFQFEDEHKVAAIRVDKIKFGILTVTDTVMNQLRREIQNPNVTIDPPWIRIKIAQ